MKFDHYNIRLLQQDDSKNFFQLIETNRKRLEDFFAGTVSKNKTLEDTETFVAEAINKIIARTYFPCVIIDKKAQRIIGFVDVKNIDWNIPKAELGCFMDEQYAGKGIATKAVSLVTNYCFKELKFNKLFLRTHPGNTRSRKIAEKAGFEIEGTIRHDYKTTKGELIDVLYYGKLRNQL